MLRSKLVPLAVALLMALPAIVVMTPAASAQDTVPVASGIRWENQLNHEQRLYATYPEIEDPTTNRVPNTPDCTASSLSPNPSTLEMRGKSDRLEATREPCAYVAQVAGQNPPAQGQASFTTPIALAHSFNVTGNTSIEYVHKGVIPSNVKLVVQIRRDASVVSTLEIPGDSDRTTFSGHFLLGPTASHEFRRGERLVLTVTGVVTGDNGLGVPDAGATTWTIFDTGTHLRIRSIDALKAATWTTDENNVVKHLFRPLEKNVTTQSRIVGWFAVQSAFGLPDARGFPQETGVVPRFSLERGGTPRPFGPNDATSVDAVYNVALSGDADGRAVWRFPAEMLDYRGMDAGEYNLTVNFDYHQGGAIRAGVKSMILIATQSLRVTPYDDLDPTTPAETNAHELAPGGSTTYVFLVNNTGSINDTFRFRTSFISGSPAGWAATIGGPRVTEGRIFLAPQQSGLVTVTVTAPPGASVGSSSIFQLEGISLTDPTARPVATTVVSTISNTVRQEVRLILPPQEVSVTPGEETRFPVYVWNRGTRFATVALEVRTTLPNEWLAQFAQGDATTVRLVVPSVPAGGIVAADFVAKPPLTLAEGAQDVVLNATQTDASGVAVDQAIRLVVRPSSGVRVQILSAVGGQGHVAELTGNFTNTPGTPAGGGTAFQDPRCANEATGRAQGDGCFQDGIDGIWFRVWVTNTGRRTEQFDLRFDAISRAECDATTFEGPVTFWFRDARGVPTPRNTVLLKPGQTGELYVWRPVNSDSDVPDRCDPGELTYTFVVEARGRDTGTIGRDGATVLAVNNAGQGYTSAVLLEHVARLPGYSSESPYVDAQNASKRAVITGIEVNTTQSYFVRLTNAASWSDYPDPYRPGRPVVRPEVRVNVAGVDLDAGWNVSIRRANGDLNPNSNPWTDTLTFVNQANNRREAWIDYEIEVLVQAPRGDNGTGLAGEQDQFTLQAVLADTGKFSTLEFKTVITEFANVTLETDNVNVFAHPGSPGAALVYVNNTGSSDALVSMRASVDPSATPNAAAWTVEPAVQTFELPAFKNRTAALLITPPAGAASGEVVVTVEYAPNPFDPTTTVNRTLRVATAVVPRGSLTMTAPSTDVTIAPGGHANYTLSLVNTGTLPVTYRVAGTSIPNWSATLSPVEGSIGAGETRSIVYVLRAPTDVVNGSRFSSVVKVEEVGNPQNFDIRPVTVSILGGKPQPSVSVPKLQKTVDRNGVQFFEVAVKNLGSAAGRIDLSARSSDPNWAVGILNARGEPISSVILGPNDLTVVNVSVRAPFTVAENTLVPVEFVAEAGGAAAKAMLQALVHDYGVSLALKPAQVDAVVGLPAEFTLTLRNTGNDNDTLNVSANLVDLPDWRVELGTERIRLEPGQSTDIRAVVRMPTQPLPVAKTYTIQFFLGTVGGQAVNIPKNDSVPATLNVLSYRQMDVDGDDFLEAAVDYDRNPANGFERFYEITPEGTTSTTVATGKLDGKTRFFLDVPRDRPVDGVADVYFDPESVYVYQIRHAPDLNFDNSPDYILDTDRDGKADRAFDAVSQAFWTVTEIESYGDDRIQYLVDLGNDNRPDRFYDPEQRLVTRTYTVTGETNAVGIDTDNDGRVDKLYDIKTSSVSDARISGAANFFVKYWYFLVGFAILVLVTVLVIVRRRG